MVWRFQYSCLSVHRHHSASVPQNALSPRWSLDCFRNCCPRRRVQLHRRTASPSSTTPALSHPRLACSTSPALVSTHSPPPRSASCMQMPAFTSRRSHLLTSFRSRRCSGRYSAVTTALRHGLCCMHSLASCCGERSMVLSIRPHQSLPPRHHRAPAHPHSIPRRPTSVRSTRFHSPDLRLSFLFPVSSVIPASCATSDLYATYSCLPPAVPLPSLSRALP